MKKLLYLMLFFNLGFSIWLSTFPDHVTIYNHLYNLSYGLIHIMCTIICVKHIFKDPSNKGVYLSLIVATTSFALAQFGWFCYNEFLKTEVPYPGIPDLFFFIFYLFTSIAGLIGLKKLQVDQKVSLLFELIVLTTVFFGLMYAFIGSVDNGLELTVQAKIANLAYPMFDAFLVAIALTAVRSKIGSLQTSLINFLISFVFLAFADTLFSYELIFDTYWNGNFVDGLFAIFSFFFALGVYDLPSLFHSSSNTAFKKL